MKIYQFPQLIKLYACWRKNQGFTPYTVELLVSSRCNLKCAMCNVWKLETCHSNLQEKELSIPEFEKLIADLSRLGTKVVYLSGGEPLLKKEIFSIIEMAKAKSMTVGMITNGTLITEKIASKLFEAGLDYINFSIDSPEATFHDEIRGVNGSWKKATQGLRLIDSFRKKMNNDRLRIVVHFLVTRKNHELIEEMIELKSQLGYDELNFLPIVGKTAATEDFFLRKNDLLALKKRLPNIEAKLRLYQLPTETLVPLTSLCSNKNIDKLENYGIYTSTLPNHLKKKLLCFAPWNMTTIDPFGNVYPCCHACTFQNLDDDLLHNYWGVSNFKLGNLKQASFEGIWNGNEYMLFREKCKDPPQFSMCKSCSYDFSKNVFLTGLFKNRTILLNKLLLTIHEKMKFS